jgi:hypothetical protein
MAGRHAPEGAFNPAQQLREQFAAWEQLGSGAELFPYPVPLAPAPQPYRHELRAPERVDDGRRLPLPLSVGTLGLADALSSLRFRKRDRRAEAESPPRVAPLKPAELHILLPRAADRGTERDLLSIGRLSDHPVSFELIGHAGQVALQLGVAERDVDAVRQSLSSLAPTAAIIPRTDHLVQAWRATGGAVGVRDLCLARSFIHSLRRRKSSEPDPLSGLIAALAGADETELAIVQVLWTPADSSWAIVTREAVETVARHPAFAREAAALVTAVREKMSEPLFAARIRLAAKAATADRVRALLRAAQAALGELTNPEGNALVEAASGTGNPAAAAADLLQRTSHRAGMILNAAELRALVHLPEVGEHTRLERLRMRSKAAPPDAHSGELILGANPHLGETRVVALSAEQRARHVYVVGGSGSGKSTLLLNLIEQDIEAGRGVAVLDPHGDLVDAILGRIPQPRIDDVVVIDPADEDYPVGINILAAHSELERTLIASDLVAVFRRQATSWGDNINSLLANAILAMLESRQVSTLLELRRFLVEKNYRAQFLRTVTDSEVVYYWEKEFPLLRNNVQAPILTRLDAFLRPRLVRNIVANPHATLDFRSLLDGRKIVLAKLAQGAIGEENAHLLGALLLAKLQQVALSRQGVDAAEREPFYVYLDEFQNFATPTTATLLSGIRKYRLGLTCAHQSTGQLSAELLDAVLANAGTRICFRLGEHDARKLAEGLAFFQAMDLQNLDVGEAIARVGRSDHDFNLRTRPARVIADAASRQRASEVVAASRRQWATPHRQSVLSQEQVAPTIPEASLVPDPTVEPERFPAPPPTPPGANPQPARPKPVSAGRGGTQHQYLQALIRRLGQDRGFVAVVEEPVLAGLGSVDVALTKGDLRIACEVWISSPTENELKNVHKSLAAGFDHVITVSQNPKSLKRLAAAATQGLEEGQRVRVHVVTPDQLPELLDQLAAPTEVRETVAGYEVSVRRTPASEGRRRAVQDVIARSLRRLKDR